MAKHMDQLSGHIREHFFVAALVQGDFHASEGSPTNLPRIPAPAAPGALQVFGRTRLIAFGHVQSRHNAGSGVNIYCRSQRCTEMLSSNCDLSTSSSLSPYQANGSSLIHCGKSSRRSFARKSGRTEMPTTWLGKPANGQKPTSWPHFTLAELHSEVTISMDKSKKSVDPYQVNSFENHVQFH